MPRHSGVVKGRQSVTGVIVNGLEIHDAGVIVILAREQGLGEIGWVHIGKWVCVSIPTTKAKIKSANSCPFVIDDDKLTWMRDVKA